MFGAKCKEHPDVELQREYPREGHGIYVEYCPHCRENSPLRQLFNQSKSAELGTMEQKFTAHNSESVAITCAECVHVNCPLREFGLEFNRGCYEGRRK